MSPYHGIVGKSQAIRHVLEEIRMVAESDTTVLIRGESGTGKEVVARAIHATSLRRYMPIVVVNCGALAEGVLESELFGHEKGAFTGAHYRRKGKFEMADGGTLFLDEIGDIGLKTQVDLLRVLEEKKICRVGGNTYLPVDFRLITATNKNLEEMVSEGTFREDFYYRLNVYSIAIPPLRQRTEDVPLLVDHFLRRFSQSMNKPVADGVERGDGLLLSHDWPGNVRELQNAMERAVLVSQGGEIRAGGSSLLFTAKLSPLVPASPSQRRRASHIHRVLQESEWNISRAARLLQIDRVTLYNKMKRYGLRRDQ